MKYKRSLIEICIVLVLLSVLLTSCNFPASGSLGATQTLTGNDWPMYGHDPSRSSINNETTLTPANIGQIAKLWTFKTQDVIAATAAVVGYTIYVGSWDGYEYAIDSQTGALDWKTYLGKTVGYPWCGPPQAGVSSSATVINGTVYVGGGDSYWYALDAKTGAIQWKVFVADNNKDVGYYNWSSPLIYKGYAYIGVSSLGDCPLAQGKLLQVSLSEHKVVRTLNIVPSGQVGGGIWSSPVMDTATNTLYLTTGNENALSQMHAQAILAVDPSTLTVKDSWRLPEKFAVIDSDFGGSPALFQTSNGIEMMVITNKNGIAYAFNANNLKAGPVWQQYIAEGGNSPDSGDGSVSTATFENGTLFIAGGNTIVKKLGYQGSVRALNPDTGKVIWQHKTTGPVLGALTYSNGMIFASAGNVLEVLDSKDGSRIASYTLDNQIYASTVVSHGQVIVGDTGGTLYDFGLPPTATVANQTSKRCSNLTCWDIGRPSHAGKDTVSGGNWKSVAGGFGVNVNTDQIHFVAQSVSGDTQISVKLTSLQGANPLAQAGLMMRQNADPGSPTYAVFVRKNNQLAVLYRTTFDGITSSLAFPTATASLPIYLEIQRVGDVFQAATSQDGVHYTLLPGSTITLAFTTKELAGLAVSAGNDAMTTTVTYQQLAFGAPTVAPTEPSSTSPCPSGWQCMSAGNPEIVGGQSLNGQTWTVRGSGIAIGGNVDQFHYVWQQLPQDGTISARITSQTATDPWAKAGLMIRQSADPSSPYYAVLLTPGNGIVVQSRTQEGLATNQFAVPGPTTPTPTPQYMQITRSGNMFSAYSSNDGVNWNYILGSTVEIDLNGPMQFGMAVTSSNW